MAFGTLFLVFAAAGEAVADERGKGGVLRAMDSQAPGILNPHLSIGNKDLNASRIVYEPLASYDKDGNLVPFLAEDIPSLANGGVANDGRSVTWTLKRDVKWADGEPFTAADVKFTFDYASNPQVGATSRASYSEVERVDIIDDHTVRVVFKDVMLDWSGPFVGPTGAIIPKHLFEAYNGESAQSAPSNRMAVGTGPYKVKDFEEQDFLIIGEDVVSTVKLTFVPNPYFREPDKPYFSSVELLGGGSAEKVADAVFKDGSIDFGVNVQISGDELDALEKLGKARAVMPPSSWTERVMFNFTDPQIETDEGERSSLDHPHPILADKAIRQAIALGIDRMAIERLYGRTGPLATNLVVSPTIFASPNTSWEFNPEKARQILADDGWSDTDKDGVLDKDGRPLSLELQTSVNNVRQATQELIKAALESIGFEIRLKTIDSKVFFGPVEDSTNTRRHFYSDLEMFAYSNKTPDPQAYLSAWICREAAQKSNNWSGANWARYCNPEFDALWDKAANELDPQKRRALIIAMNDLLINDYAVVPLVERPEVLGIANSLEGFIGTAWDQDFWNIKDWRRRE